FRPMNDEELIARSRNDHGAFANLFDRHSDAVFRYAFTLTRNADSAQDLVQESFITAWKRLSDIRLVGDSMLPWLLVACRNHNANRQRSSAAHATVPLHEGGQERTDIDTRRDHIEELRNVIQAVGQMSETDQRIVALCLFDGRSYKEAASILGLKPNTVSKRVQRARARLRTTFQEGEAQA
ncbi:MAG: RNA polymerase sigma factor, partial [Pseudolysinimonas sp.]